MKLILQENKNLKETIIDITYNVLDRRVKKIIEMVETQSVQLEGRKEEQIYLLNSSDIYYIESVDSLSFLYKESNVFESKEKLYMLESILKESSFIRINKSTLLNMDYLESVYPLPNYRLGAKLKNKETLIISRHYLKDIKQYIKKVVSL